MYIHFLGSKELIPCTVVPEGNIVTLKFEDRPPVQNTTGFHLYLDAKGEYDIGGDFYTGFKTLYRNDETTLERNEIQLSCDESVYVYPESEEQAEVTEITLTDEEIAEQERLNEISIINNQITYLKMELASTDYIIIKMYEASLVGESLEEYNIVEIHAARQALRNQINCLEDELIKRMEEERNGEEFITE